MEQAQPTLRLRVSDREVLEVDARRLAALFPARVIRVPAIDNFGIFMLISMYRVIGRHTDPDVERALIATMGDLDNLTGVASAAMQLGDDDLLNLCLRATVVIIVQARAAETLQNLQMQEQNH